MTSGGRAFVSIFAILGIPLTALVISGIGEKIQNLIKPITDRVWVKGRKKIDSVLKTVSIILVGMVCFFLIPTGIFSHIEGSTYGEGIYFTIITLTTVGFGDFVIGKSHCQRTPYLNQNYMFMFIEQFWKSEFVDILRPLGLRWLYVTCGICNVSACYKSSIYIYLWIQNAQNRIILIMHNIFTQVSVYQRKEKLCLSWTL